MSIGEGKYEAIEELKRVIHEKNDYEKEWKICFPDAI